MSEAMTEDEAKAKWCPFAMGTTTVNDGRTKSILMITSANRTLDDKPSGLCLGSACMAWRWWPSHGPDPDNPGGDLILLRETWGFCGLAGKP